MPAQGDDRYALILAGGSGTRFWPVSRDRLPKQLLELFGPATLLETTVERVAELVPEENILILTNALQVPEIRKVLPDFPTDNIIAEPERRDTAPAIALGIGLVAARNPQATMLVLPSDHLIQNADAYRATMRGALAVAQDCGLLVTIGIQPSWPCPDYGYIEHGEQFTHELPEGAGELCVHRVRRFTEKPDRETARGFLDTGNFAWNAGMFIWTVATIRRELSTHCPELAAFVTRCAQSDDVMATVAEDFATLPRLSIDFALMERSSETATIAAGFDWDDVGSWPSVAEYLDKDAAKNSSNSPLTGVDAQHNIVFSRNKKHVALLGVDDLIIVETDDAILVADRKKADEIKKVVANLPENLR
jgi:mannose-1-phosphate guanylyltransferase